MIQRTLTVFRYILWLIFIAICVLLLCISFVTWPVFYIITGHTVLTLPRVMNQFETKYFKSI